LIDVMSPEGTSVVVMVADHWVATEVEALAEDEDDPAEALAEDEDDPDEEVGLDSPESSTVGTEPSANGQTVGTEPGIPIKAFNNKEMVWVEGYIVGEDDGDTVAVQFTEPISEFHPQFPRKWLCHRDGRWLVPRAQAAGEPPPPPASN